MHLKTHKLNKNLFIKGEMRAMSTMKSSQTVYYGPKADLNMYPKVGSVSANEQVKVVLKEVANGNTWAYIEYNVTGSTQKKRGYVLASTVSITENVTTYNTSKQTRYVRTASSTYLGPDANKYPVAGSVSLGEEVSWVCSVREGAYVLIEYDISGGQKKRAYIDANCLGTSAPEMASGRYIQGGKINSAGDYWHITNQWNGNNNANTNGHLAIDVVRKNSSGTSLSGKEVYAIADGTVVDRGSQKANGNYVIIRHSTAAGKIYYSLYYHLKESYNKTSVKKNEAIGIMGNTGSSSVGEHLHLGITKNQPAGGYYGYYYVNGVKTRFSGETYVDNQNNRFYNPTKYFTQGESIINNNY